MKIYFVAILLLLFVIPGITKAQADPVQWKFSAKKLTHGEYELHTIATIAAPWHLYSQHTPEGGPVPTLFSFGKNPMLALTGTVAEKGELVRKREEVFGIDVMYYNGRVDFVQALHLKTKVKTRLTGMVKYMVCNDKECLAPKTVPFSVVLQ